MYKLSLVGDGDRDVACSSVWLGCMTLDRTQHRAAAAAAAAAEDVIAMT